MGEVSFGRLIYMGSYTVYVWSAYGITVLGLGTVVWTAFQRLERERLEARRRRQVRD
jgi:heme exporter protein CcmD